MKPVEIKKGIYWVGAVDWDLRDFHGYMTAPQGTTYNAFLIVDDKITLVDTVKKSFFGQFMDTISQVVDPARIDYLVVNHVEPDHSGCLPETVAAIKPEKIIISTMGHKSVQAYYHDKDWPYEVAKSGAVVPLGKRSLHFLETRMLHWPDNMACYIPEDKLLISSDAFGQNLASTERFADQIDRDTLERQLARYYANIVLPYSPVAAKTLDTLAAMNLDIDMIVPDHGLMFRGDDVSWVIDTYRRYIAQKPTMRAVISYDTMWHSTERMAQAIAEGLLEQGVDSRLMCVKSNHHSDILAEIASAGAFVVGSPTHNNGIMPLVADLLTYVKGLKPQNKITGAFGSYGWSGESVKDLIGWLESMKLPVVEGAPRVYYAPTEQDLEGCREYGRKIAAALKALIAS